MAEPNQSASSSNAAESDAHLPQTTALTSMVLGIIAIAVTFVPVLGTLGLLPLLLAVLSIIVGVTARDKISTGLARGRGFSTAGIALGAAELLLLVVLFFVALSHAQVREFADGRMQNVDLQIMSESGKIQVGNIIEWAIDQAKEELAGTTKAVSSLIVDGYEWGTDLLLWHPVALLLLLAAAPVFSFLSGRLPLVARLVILLVMMALGVGIPFIKHAVLPNGNFDWMQAAAPLIVVVLFALFAWWLTRRLGLAAFALVGLLLLFNLDLWTPTMETLALVILATLITIVIGVPIGVIAAIFEPVQVFVKPILDFMQTLPAFVYLIPAVPFFGLGATAAMFSTIIFSMPPAIRLTALGIQQVPADLVEAADAFGSTTFQKLIKLQLPVAAPSIRAGINQVIMLALSMVVIAAMIGADGLGAEVWKGIQRMDIGMGFEGGIGIVITAIILDRVMQSAGAKRNGKQ